MNFKSLGIFESSFRKKDVVGPYDAKQIAAFNHRYDQSAGRLPDFWEPAWPGVDKALKDDVMHASLWAWHRQIEANKRAAVAPIGILTS